MAIRINDNSSNFTGKASITISSFSPSLVGTITSPSSTIDGSLNRALSSFHVVIRDESWPRFWPQVAGQYAISDQPNVLGTYGDWTARKDMTIFQAYNWATGATNQTNTANRIRALKSTYGTYCKYVCYNILMWAKDDSSHRKLSYDLMSLNGALDTWACHDNAGNVLYGTRDQTDSILANVSDVCPLVGGKNYNEAFVDLLYERLALGTDMTDGVIDGVYIDSTDRQNAFPQLKSGSSLGADYDGVPDYDYDGAVNDNTQSDYRNGLNQASEYFRDKALTAWTTPASCGVSCNGGRDPFVYNAGSEDLVNDDWYQVFDNRVMENAHWAFGLNFISNGLLFQFGDIYNRLTQNILRATAVGYTLCKPVGSNKFGRPYGMIDVEVGGFTGCDIFDFDQAERDWASFWYAICMLDERFMYGGLVNKRQPAPTPDEWFYDIGNPVRTREIGTLANDGTWTMRVADDSVDGNWFFEEFENGYFYVNLNELNSEAGTLYQSLGGTTNATTAYPATPAGKVARRLNASTYVSPTSGLSPFNYNPSRNDGSLAYNGSNELVDGQWRGGLVIWADS